MVKNGCAQSADRSLKNEKWTNGINDFLHVDTTSQKLKTDQKIFGVGL